MNKKVHYLMFVISNKSTFYDQISRKLSQHVNNTYASSDDFFNARFENESLFEITNIS